MLITERYVVEPKIHGFRCIIHKKGNTVQLYEDGTIDVTKLYPSFVDLILQSSNNNYILDCIMSTKTLFVYDILFYGHDISNLSWDERHKYLSKISYSTKFKLIPTHIIKGYHDIHKFITFVSNLEGSGGAMIKKVNSKYPQKTTTDWLTFERC